MNTIRNLSTETIISLLRDYEILSAREKKQFTMEYDEKAAYHIIRLSEQCQQILEEGDMDITRCAEMLKSIRRGEWTLERVKERFLAKEKTLDELYTKSSLRYAPDMKFLREILMSCIEMKYGRIDAIQKSDDGVAAIKLQQIKKILES